MSTESLNQTFSMEIATRFKCVKLAILYNFFLHKITINASLNKNFIEGRTWFFDTISQISAEFPYWSVKQVERMINQLVDRKVLIKGNFNQKKYDRTLWYAFKNEDLSGISRIREMGFPQHFPKSGEAFQQTFPEIGRPIPIPSIPLTNKGIENSNTSSNTSRACDPPPTPQGYEKGFEKKLLPFSKNEKKRSSKRLYERTPEKQKCFEWLKTLDINASEDSRSVWANKYPQKKLEDAWAHVCYKLLKGYKPKNLAGLFVKIVERESCPMTAVCEKNKKKAEMFKKEKNWHGLTFHDKFCCDDIRPEYDLDFRLDEKQFEENLIKMWKFRIQN